MASETWESLVLIRKEIGKLRYGQASQLKRLVEKALELLAELDAPGEASSFQTQFRLKHTLGKEVEAVVNHKAVTKSTTKQQIRSQEEAFKKAVEQVVYELWDFRE